MTLVPVEDQDSALKKRLEKYVQEIRCSYIHDVDKTDEMIKIKNFIKSILESDESFEHHFNDNQELLKYFMTGFLKNIISNILAQYIIYGDNGDDIAVDLLYHIYKLFLKFHKETKYSELFSTIREMIKSENSLQNFFKMYSEQRSNLKIFNIKRKYNGYNFNKKYCNEFIDKAKEPTNIYKIGDKVDILIQNAHSRSLIDRKVWVRGIIESIDEENMQYLVHCESMNQTFGAQMCGGEITDEGEKTKDWDWRLNLKKYDVIDCYDRNKWYPSTITNVKDGNKLYHVGFRLYPKYFKNEEDENDKYENYKFFWEGQKLFLDKKGEECFGDQDNFDEDIYFFSKRIQKFQSYSNIQKNYLDTPIQYYAQGRPKKSDIKNQMQLMNYELENDEIEPNYNDDMMLYEVNGKKNYIIGKNNKFSYYYAIFWKKLADDGVFEEFIEILNNKPNSEEIYTILYTIYCAMPYLHKQYLIENLDNFKNAIMNFIKNLDTKEIRNLPKNISEIFFKFLKSINELLMKEDSNIDDKNIIKTIDEISISLSIKMLKTSIFDKRMQGIKTLTEFISENEFKEETMKTLIDLIQKNEIIKEIFGPNYHSQIISKSDKILSLLLKNNQVKEEDIKLIWDCTQRGDLEVKNIIMKLLSDLAENLNENFINILLENVMGEIEGDKMNEKDIDFIYNLSIHGDNENNKNKCCEYLYQLTTKLDVNVNEYEIKSNPIVIKLLTFAQSDDKYLIKILALCEQDLKNNNNSLPVFQLLSILIDKYTLNLTELTYLNEPIKEFMADDKLLNLYKDNFVNYIQKIKEQIQTKNEEEIINYDDEIVDNYTHVINIQKRIEFLTIWITVIYPSFDFVSFLKEILLTNPISKNDEIIFYDFIQKFISETSAMENTKRKEKKEQMKSQLFQDFIENDQTYMTFSEFKLFISIFLSMNSANMCYLIDKDDNYEIILSCQSVEDIKDLDKLWNVIFQLKDERVLNKAISIIFNIYKGVNEIEKLLIKCKELIKYDDKNEENNNIDEVINKCFKLLRMIILESEKEVITKTKSHSNLLKNCYIYLPLKIMPKYSNYYYNGNANANTNENGQINTKAEVLYGNTTINEIKELLIEREKIPLKSIEINLSKEYMNSINNNSIEENEFLLDETYNNKSIMEILENNYNQNMPLEKIFIFYSKNVEKESLLINNEFNPKFEQILKEWFAEFTHGEEKMDMQACSNYISKVTGTSEMTSLNDIRVTEFFNEYDKEKTGYITEEKFLEFYLNALRTHKDDTVWENLKYMGIREDLQKISDEYPIPYSENNVQPRFSLGNDKDFIENLFFLYKKCGKKKEIFEFLFFLATNQDIYDDILYNLNDIEKNNFETIFFDEKNNYLKALYSLIVIESILQDINIDCTDFNALKNKFVTNENGVELIAKLTSKKYEHFDEIDIETKKNFLKNFIISKNYEKLLKYLNELLLNYKFDKNENENEENLIINLCCEKCLNIVNIIYNSTNNKNTEKENDNISTNNILNEIISFDYNNLFNFIKTDEKIKQSIEQINFFDYATNLINFVDSLNVKINFEEDEENNNNNKYEQNNLLQNSFSLLINLVTNNEKLILELYSKNETKNAFENLIKSVLNTTNEAYKIFYIKCFINSTKNSEKNSENKFLNLLFELTNDIIFNHIMNDDNIDKVSYKSSVLFFDFFSILTSKLEDNIGKEFLFQIYQYLFHKLENIEDEKNISKDVFLGLMTILIKRIKINEDLKNIIMNKEINQKTLLDLILDKIYQNNNNESENENEVIIEIKDDNKPKKEIKEEPLFISLETIKHLNQNNQNKEIPKEIKEICSQYLLEILKSSSNEKTLNKLISIIKTFSSNKSEEQKEELIMKKHKSPPSLKKLNHVGLKNLGCICYMNSILQQVYMVPTFRYAIMGYKNTPLQDQNEDDPLNQLQIMYSYLTLSEKEDYNPKNFCQVFKDFDGNPINTMVQQDSQEFFNNFFDQMENYLRNNKYKYIINDVFIGRTCSSVICESCKHISNRFEDFYNLTLEVKNINNLTDSLHKLIMPEKIDDFKCSNCNQNVTINKLTSLSDLPNILVFHLKRFYMNYEIERTEKINSRFEFPLNINMKEFCIEDIEISGKKFENEDIYMKDDSYYLYELKGINIHMGSADGGHYFSLINILRDGEGNILMEKSEENDELNNDNKNSWLKFNDSHISVFDINDIEKECYGGASKAFSGYNYENFQNAYMLIYERKKKTPIRLRYDENEIKEICDLEKEQKNIININNENKASIKKMYNLAKKDTKIDEQNLYEKIFNDQDKKEYYKYIPFYSIEKCVPKYIYDQIKEKNEQLHKLINSENENDNHQKDYYEILINNINISEFNIFKFNEEIKSDLINILIEQLFPKDQYLYEEEKLLHNKKSKIILEKIILPIINNYSKEQTEENNKNNKLISMIATLLCQKEKMKRIFTNDSTDIFDNSNVEIFYNIIKNILNIYISRNNNKYLSIIEYLLNLIQEVDTIETYPKKVAVNNTNQEEETSLYYVYKLLYECALIEKKIVMKLINQSFISELLGKLTSENKKNKNVIFDIVIFLLKNLDDYNDTLFDIDKKEKSNSYFHEKHYLIRNISPIFIELLFNEKIDLLIILLKLLQYDEPKFSRDFNSQSLFDLFAYSTKENKISDMNKVLFGILEINDKCTLDRLNYILGYPTLIIKDIKYNNTDSKLGKEKEKEKNLINDLYDEENKENIIKEKKDEIKIDYQWPLFGERLINEKGDAKYKLNKHIFKYISYYHENDDFCLLSRLMPELDDNGEIINKVNKSITEKERKDLIYDFLKLMLLGKGNYTIFKYIYLSPARCILYNNLYEEMLDILEQENNSVRDKIYDLTEIKQNAEICIKKINYEVDMTLKYLKESEIINEEIEYELPEKMQKYFVQNDDVEKYIGNNPNLIPGEIVKEKVLILTQEGGLYLMRLEYITEFKTPEEVRNKLLLEQKEEKENDKGDKNNKEENKIEENKTEKEEKNEDKNIENAQDDDNESIDSDSNSSSSLKLDISKVNHELDKKDLLLEITRKYRIERNYLTITNSSFSEKKEKNEKKIKVKSTLIRFTILNLTTQESPMVMRISQNNIPDDVKQNYYYPLSFWDFFRGEDASNFMNIYRIRNDLPFLKKKQIGINIDIKKKREYEA